LEKKEDDGCTAHTHGQKGQKQRTHTQKKEIPENTFILRLGSSSHFLFVFLARSSDWLTSLFIVILLLFLFMIPFFFSFRNSRTGTVL